MTWKAEQMVRRLLFSHCSAFSPPRLLSRPTWRWRERRTEAGYQTPNPHPCGTGPLCKAKAPSSSNAPSPP